MSARISKLPRHAYDWSLQIYWKGDSGFTQGIRPDVGGSLSDMTTSGRYL
jgi:hypothetical protein